jgi:hypothetical protein
MISKELDLPAGPTPEIVTHPCARKWEGKKVLKRGRQWFKSDRLAF